MPDSMYFQCPTDTGQLNACLILCTFSVLPTLAKLGKTNSLVVNSKQVCPMLTFTSQFYHPGPSKFGIQQMVQSCLFSAVLSVCQSAVTKCAEYLGLISVQGQRRASILS